MYPLEHRKFDEVLPGLGAFLRGRCPNLKRFQIDYESFRLDMFVADEDQGKYTDLTFAVPFSYANAPKEQTKDRIVSLHAW